MTLDTRMYVLDPVNVTDLFREGQRLLGLADKDKRGPDRQKWTDKQDKTWRKGESFIEPGNPWTIGNDPMQSLPGWLMVHYRRDGAYRTARMAAEHDEWSCNIPAAKFYEPAEPLCQKTEHDVPCWAEVSIDTAYGYRGPDGLGCGDLHAAFVAALGEWLEARGVRWAWQNEFTSEVHGGDDRYVRLVDLCSGGFEATAWFTTTVLPAIGAMIEGGRRD